MREIDDYNAERIIQAYLHIQKAENELRIENYKEAMKYYELARKELETIDDPRVKRDPKVQKLINDLEEMVREIKKLMWLDRLSKLLFYGATLLFLISIIHRLIH